MKLKHLLLLTAAVSFVVPFGTCAAVSFSTDAPLSGHFIPSSRFSSSLISSLCQDRQGSIWVATDYGLNRYDGHAFQTFLHDDNDSTSLQDNMVTRLLCDRQGRLWVGTNRGLDRFDPATETFVHYSLPSSPRITMLLQRHDGTLLIGTAGYGAYTMDMERAVVSPFTSGELEAYSIVFYEDSRGRLWRGGFDERMTMRSNGGEPQTFTMRQGRVVSFVEHEDRMLIVCQHGIASYKDGVIGESGIDMSVVHGKNVIFTKAVVSPDNDIILCTRGQGIYRISSERPYKLESIEIDAYGITSATAKVMTAMFDHAGNLWLGCERKGLLMVSHRPVFFRNWSFENQGVHLGSTVSSVCEGDGDIIWCTVQGVGVYGFNRQGRIVAHPNAPEAVEFIFRDRQSRFWVGTDDGLFSYNPQTGAYKREVSYECDKFNDMTSDEAGNIYISTFSQGFCVYNPKTGALKNHNIYDTDTLRGRLCNNWVMGLATDSQGLLWLATSSGLACYSPADDSFLSQGWQSQLDDILCFDVCELHKGLLPDGRQLNNCIAIGTERGLFIYDRIKRQAERFPNSEELANKVVSYIVQSDNGDLWCSTSAGIWQYSLKVHKFISHSNEQEEYVYGVGIHTSKGLVCFGHNEGLTVFDPKDAREYQLENDSLVLTAFRVGDQYVKAGTVINGVEVTDRAVTQSDYFTLSYLDHTITLAFSQFNFEDSKTITLEYSINGEPWIRNQLGKNDITLGHLQPGTYRITVRASRSGDYSPEKVLVVTIRAPWYRSATAYVLYFLLAVGLLYFGVRTMRRRADEQLNEEKMKFLINATHDIRSPLTLIMGPLTNLKRRLAGNMPEAQRDIETIEHNAQRILDLVSQILDVRKIDKQQMHLHCRETNLVEFTDSICKMYEYTARERGITFVHPQEEDQPLKVWIDRRQMDKVVNNLLSNAFKYSYNGGYIEVRLSAVSTGKASDGESLPPTHAELQVIDNGAGLDGEGVKHIFDRFYQGNNSRRLNIDGTGIGLNLCKMIVDMHSGTITAANRPNGERGSVFTVRIPLGNAHLKAEEMETTEESTGAIQQVSHTPGQRPQTKHRVLVVDDDMEVARYISQELGRYYRFGIAPNGKEGLRLLLTGDYDVVVSDVMMPEMDGFTMLRMIKTNLNISHLPVIMLTSKADVGNRLEGLERGADAFLAKPFDMEELHMNIENCINTLLRLKGKFSGAQQQADKVEAPEVKGNDEELMERVMKVVNKHLGDSEFTVDQLTQEACISRTQLHRKMKELTGLSTSEFIRNLRLEQAARLLKEQKINITQVAYTVGFSNVAHFSSVFRKHFGMTPTEYIKS